MKYLVLISSLVFVLTNESANIDLTPKILKSIEKEINRNWKGVNVSRSFLSVSDSIAEFLQIETANSFVLLNNSDTLAFLFIRRTNGCVIGGCTDKNRLNKPVSNNFAERYEHFDYMIILNKDLSVIKVKVLVYDGEYGYEITSKLWLKQFIDYSGKGLNYGSDIQAISGATISARSITNDIEQVVLAANELRKLGEI